jgi:RNA polymerase sigma-70 factor (ECF subfamily)
LEQSLESETDTGAQFLDTNATPDRAYEKQWALALLDHTLVLLRQQILTNEGREQFDALKVFVWGDSPTISQAEIAAQLGMTSNALGVVAHRLRRRYAKLLREAIGRTVADPAEIDTELRHLIEMISN